MSDLHLEFGWRIKFNPHPDTILVLAGDIDSDYKGGLDGVVAQAVENYKEVIFVAGNHEYYGNEFTAVNHELEDMGRFYDNFTFLNDNFITMDGVTFIGSTLWSNPDVYAFQRVNDKNLIKFHNKSFGIDDIRELNARATLFIKEALEKIDGKKVVVTHFGPDQRLMNPKWINHIVQNSYFWASGFEDYFKLADMWLFGHTHDPTDMVIDGCRCVCNPHGYVFARGTRKEHYDFNENLILEI